MTGKTSNTRKADPRNGADAVDTLPKNGPKMLNVETRNDVDGAPVTADRGMTGAGSMVVDPDGHRVDRDAFAKIVWQAFGAIGPATSRVEFGNEIAKDRGLTRRGARGEQLDHISHYRMKMMLRRMAQAAHEAAYGGDRFTACTEQDLREAEIRAEMAHREAEAGKDAPVAAAEFQLKLARHTHENVVEPVAEAMRAVYEHLIGEPLELGRAPEAKAPASKGFEDF